MDLLTGELSSDEERSLRVAIEGCDDCGPEFEMMALLMDFSGPALTASAPIEMDAMIMAAARAHTEQAPTKATQAPAGVWARLGQWLETFAIGPQFAMATVMVLVVAVGFWYVPKHESHEVAGSTVVVSDPEGEAVAADDPETRALLGAGETRQEIGDPTPIGLAERDVVTPEPEGESLAVAEPTSTMRPTGQQNRRTPPAAQEPVAQEPVAQAPLVQEQSVRTHTDMAMTRGVTRMTIPPERRIDNQGNDDVEDLHSQSAAWARELDGIPMPTYSDEGPAAPSTAGSTAQAPAAEGSQVWQPNEVATPATTSSPSRALLQLARNHRAQARCDQAVRHYESLLARFAGSPEVPQALMESADCYRRLGRISDAERVLRRALQFASTRTNARRELTRLETIRAAQRESNAPSAAPDDFAADY